MSVEAGAHEEREQCGPHRSAAGPIGPRTQRPTQTGQSETRHGSRETASDMRQSEPRLKSKRYT